MVESSFEELSNEPLDERSWEDDFVGGLTSILFGFIFVIKNLSKALLYL